MIVGAVAAATPAFAHGTLETVSVAVGGQAADFHSREPTISADGRYVAFASLARNLPGPLGYDWNLFVRDRKLRRTVPVSVGRGGEAQDGWSIGPSISADGRFVAFTSSSSNLVADDRNAKVDVFVRDLRRGTTRLVSLGPGGRQANWSSEHAVLSGDGRYVAFYSGATNLVPHDRNEKVDVFVHDLHRSRTELASVAADGGQGDDASGYAEEGLAMSRNGRFVVFASGATNLVPGDDNEAVDVFLRDRARGTTELVSVGPGGVQGNASSGYVAMGLAVSPDGRFVAFLSDATNLVRGDSNGVPDVFVRDRKANTTTRVSVGRRGAQANGGSGIADTTLGLSDDGRFVAFSSVATNLVPRDDGAWSDVFVHDRLARRTIRVSESRGGKPGSGDSRQAVLSADGRAVAFTSAAEDLQGGGSGNDATPWDQVLVRVPLR
jgi:Tol biopolymer transport system component